MSRTCCYGVVALAATLALGLAASAEAQIGLSLSSPHADPANLQVGQTVTFQVDLSGLGGAQELDSLAATVVYDDTLLGDPTISPGAIVPNPLDDPFDFAVSEWPGEADASFLTFSEETTYHITADGAFFSFDVTVLAAGTGDLSFDFVDATEFNSADPFNPILLFPDMGPPLAFTASSVPEPTTLLLLTCATFFLLLSRSRRR